MTGAAAIAAGVIAATAIFLSLAITGIGVWTLEAIQARVRPFPVVGGQLADLVGNVEGWFLSAARIVVTAWFRLLTLTGQLVKLGVLGLVELITRPLTEVVSGIWAQASGFFTILTLATLPPVEREIPAWFKHLDDELKALPNEPAFRDGGPLRLVLQWLSAIWAVVSRLGPFLRLVALPVLLVLGLLWGLVELLGRITRLETIQAGLVGFTKNLDIFRLRDEANIQQLYGLWFQTSQQVGILQADLVAERAARVALATQTEQALSAATAAQAAQNAQTRSLVNPLLILGVLTALGASGLQTLRKTAECDPCAQLDQITPDFEERISALETFGEG